MTAFQLETRGGDRRPRPAGGGTRAEPTPRWRLHRPYGGGQSARGAGPLPLPLVEQVEGSTGVGRVFLPSLVVSEGEQLRLCWCWRRGCTSLRWGLGAPLAMAFTFAAFCYMLSLVLCAALIFFAIWHVSTAGPSVSFGRGGVCGIKNPSLLAKTEFLIQTRAKLLAEFCVNVVEVEIEFSPRSDL